MERTTDGRNPICRQKPLFSAAKVLRKTPSNLENPRKKDWPNKTSSLSLLAENLSIMKKLCLITLPALFATLLAGCQPTSIECPCQTERTAEGVQQDVQTKPDPAPLSTETAENYKNYNEAVRYIDAAKPPRNQFAKQPQPADSQLSLANYDDYPLPTEVEAAIKYLTNEITQMKANLIEGSPDAMDKIKEIAEETIIEFPKLQTELESRIQEIQNNIQSIPNLQSAKSDPIIQTAKDGIASINDAIGIAQTIQKQIQNSKLAGRITQDEIEQLATLLDQFATSMTTFFKIAHKHKSAIDDWTAEAESAKQAKPQVPADIQRLIQSLMIASANQSVFVDHGWADFDELKGDADAANRQNIRAVKIGEKLIERLEEESTQLREILLQPTKNLVEAHDTFAVLSQRISKAVEEWTFESNRKIAISSSASAIIRRTYEDGMGDSELINIMEHRIRAFKIAVQKLMN